MIGPIVVTSPGDGNEYEPFTQMSDGQSMNRPFTKLRPDAAIHLLELAQVAVSNLAAASTRGRCRLTGPPENATSAAPGPGWPSVPSHVSCTAPSESESGASSDRAPEPILHRDEALHVGPHLRLERRRQRRLEPDAVPHRRRHRQHDIVGLERAAVRELHADATDRRP